MNIWIIDHYSSEPRHGGISRQYDFANGLSARGHKVLVVSSAFSHFSHKYITTEECMISQVNPNAHYAYVHTPEYSENKSAKRFLNTLAFVKSVLKNEKQLVCKFGKPDVVVGCSIHPFTWIAAHKISKKYNARFIAEVRDLWPASWIYNKGLNPKHPKALLFSTLEKWAYDRAETIIYSMSKGHEYICDILGYPREKTIWIDQPMDCERFDTNAARYAELPAEIRDFIGDGFLCVFGGYYMIYEGVYEMLEAAKILSDKGLPVKFVFVGSGKEAEGMQKYVDDNNLQNVLVYGRISKELIPALLRRAQITLAHLAVKNNPNSYRFDASKNKINEYMYSDSCVIYGTCLKDHFVKTSGAGFTITPYSSQEFADKIEAVYKMPEVERAVFGKKACEYIKSNNTLDVLTDKYISILNK